MSLSMTVRQMNVRFCMDCSLNSLNLLHIRLCRSTHSCKSYLPGVDVLRQTLCNCVHGRLMRRKMCIYRIHRCDYMYRSYETSAPNCTNDVYGIPLYRYIVCNRMLLRLPLLNNLQTIFEKIPCRVPRYSRGCDRGCVYVGDCVLLHPYSLVAVLPYM